MPTDTISQNIGLRGLDLFTLANKSISGFIPSYKPDPLHPVRQPFCSHLEERFLLYCEYHPLITRYQRGEISEQFAQAYRVPTYLPTPYGISYVFEGEAHTYLPDLVGTFTNGTLFVGEAGMEEDKSLPKNLAKADAARRLVATKGGEFWLGTERTLPLHRHYNFVFLHARRPSFPTFASIAEVLLDYWLPGDPLSVNEAVERFGGRWSEDEVAGAMWKIAADAAAQGRLLVDLATVDFDRSTPLRLLTSTLPPLLPEPLPQTLEIRPTHNEASPQEDALLAPPIPLLPGPAYDDAHLSETVRQQFLNNLHAVLQILEGYPLVPTAREYGIAPSTLSRLVKRAREFGQKACVPYATYQRDRGIDPAFCHILDKLERLPNLSVRAIHEHTLLREEARTISKIRATLMTVPTYDQVWDYIHYLRTQLHKKPSKQPHENIPERMSPRGFIAAIPMPALIIQVDEHYLDTRVVLPDGTSVTKRIHGAVSICPKTGSIMGALIVPGALTDEDYMQLLKNTIEPKDELAARMGCRNPWPCYGKPAIIFSDRGKIFVSKRARDVIVDRFGIISEVAPPYCPSVKGTVESVFRWMTQRFEMRLPAQSMATTDPIKAALEAGLLFEDIERYFYRAIVDDYQQDFDNLRGQYRDVIWRADVERYGVSTYLDSPDALKLLLMKGVNRKNTTGRFAVQDGQRISFGGRWYISPGVLSRLRGQEFDIYYSRRDLGVIYLFTNGEFVSEAYCPQLVGRRVSEWEDRADKRRRADLKAQHGNQSLSNRQDIQAEALATGQRQHRKSAKAIQQEAREFHYDQHEEAIHPVAVQKEIQKRRAAEQQRVGQLADVPPDTEESPVRLLHIRPISQMEEVDGE